MFNNECIPHWPVDTSGSSDDLPVQGLQRFSEGYCNYFHITPDIINGIEIRTPRRPLHKVNIVFFHSDKSFGSVTRVLSFCNVHHKQAGE